MANMKEMKTLNGYEVVDAKARENIDRLSAHAIQLSEQIADNTSRVNRNDKRLTNLEMGLPADRWAVDDTVAYVKDVPVNTLPYAGIDMIGGMTRKCTNLLDGTYEQAYYTDAGVLTSHKQARVSGFIRINGEPIVFQAKLIASGDALRISAFDKDQNFIERKDFGGGTECAKYSNPSAVFVRVGIMTTSYDENTLMLNEGTELLPYEPYFDGLRSAPVTEVESVGQNICDEMWNVSADGAHLISKNYIPVTPKTTYYLNFRPANGIYGYNKEKEKISVLTYNSGAFTVPTDVYFIKLYMSSDYGTVYNHDIMLNKGTTALPYRPYVRNTLTIPEEVRNLDGYGWGITADCYNYIDFEKKQFVKRVKKVVLDGSSDEVWAQNNGWGKNNSNYFAIRLDANSFGYGIQKTIADEGWRYDTSRTKDGCFSSNFGWFVFYTSTITSISDWLTFLSSNPIDVCYELAEPVITDISDMLSPDNLIGVEGGGTVTMVNEYEYDVPSKIVYQLKGVEA